MMVMMTCSLTVNGPGLMDTPKMRALGSAYAQSLHSGNVSSCGTIYMRAQTPTKFKNRDKTPFGQRAERRGGSGSKERERGRTWVMLTDG